jgi:AcrR family transcriptional regulator
MTSVGEAPGGLRERKRQETFQRIAETGLRLFVENGYEATTLEAIATASGISRRTFFYYFDSKEEILQHFQSSGFHEALGPALLAMAPDQDPLDAVRDCLLGLVSRYETPRSILVDRLLRSCDMLRKQKLVMFDEMEGKIFAALREVWPQPDRLEVLQMTAMAAVGAMRLGMDAWRQDEGKRPIADYVREAFDRLRATV